MMNTLHLREIFDNDLGLFLDFAGGIKDYSIRFGYDTPQDLWQANPLVSLTDRKE